MGGLSARELLEGPTVAREGDFVENCLKNLAQKSKDNDDDDDDDYDDYDDEEEGTDHQPKITKRIYLNRKRRRPNHHRRHKTPQPHIRQ